MKNGVLLTMGGCVALWSCVSCQDDWDDVHATGGTESGTVALTFAATKQHLITRAGDAVTLFQPGSDFRLFATKPTTETVTEQVTDTTGTPRDTTYTKVNEPWYTSLYGAVGTGDADGNITYSPMAYYQTNVPLNFYAVAIDRVVKDETAYSIGDAMNLKEGDAPTLTWKWGLGLPAETDETDEAKQAYVGPGDLMISNTVKGATQSSGTTTLPFKHALTRFTFAVSKQDETGKGDDTWLDGVRITGIRVEGTHREATLDLRTGLWTPTGDATHMDCDATGWNSGTDPVGLLTTTEKTLPDTLLLFPNDEGSVLQIIVTLYYPHGPTTQGVGFLKENTDRIKIETVEGDEKARKVTITTPLTEYNLMNKGEATDNKPYHFLANSSYKFSISAMRDEVSVLVIAPTVYDWVEEDLLTADDVVLGQPVTFGGLMWMDRNIGASTNDAENDFYGAIGYYYQYGRNIPYIMDVKKLTHYIDDDDTHSLNASASNGFTVIMPTKKESVKKVDSGIKTTSPYYPRYYHDGNCARLLNVDTLALLAKEQEECFFTYDHQGNSVTGYHLVKEDDEEEDDDLDPVRLVGDVIYNKSGEVDNQLTHEGYKFSVLATAEDDSHYYQWTSKDLYAQDYWIDQANQPCPKGWRLPTRKELYAFMPWGLRIPWLDSGTIYASDETGTTGANFSASTIHYWDFTDRYPDKTSSEDYYIDTYKCWWIPGTKGWYRKDEGKTDYGYNKWTQEVRFGQVHHDTDGTDTNVVYMLRYNSDQAYRIRIESKFSKGYLDPNQDSKNKRYITIARYSADVDDFKGWTRGIDYYTQGADFEQMWDNPIETIQYPCAGFIVTEKTFFDLRSFGTGAVMRTAESNNSTSLSAKSWVQYLATTNFSVQVSNDSRRSLGDQVRCCRDISVSD